MSMVNIKKQTTNSVKIQQTANMIAAICPYRDKNIVFSENFSLTPSENGTGWFFECKVCAGARCTGFLRNDT